MKNIILEKISSFNWRQFTDIRNIGLYAFLAITLMVVWNGVQTIQSNYKLQQKIAKLEQQNKVQKLENENLNLKNKFLETEEFLDISARRQFGKAAPGEKVILVPKEVALSYVEIPKEPQYQPQTTKEEEKSSIQTNLEAWKDFLLGKSKAPSSE